MAENRRASLAGAFILGLALALSLLSSGCSGKSNEAPKETTITVVDYNIMHGLFDEDPDARNYDRFADRLSILAGELARLKPDVVILQEVVLQGPKDYPDVKAILLDALGAEYKAVFAESGTTRINEGQAGRMTLTRLPVVVDLAENKVIYQGRSALRVSTQTDGGVIDFFNVHMEGSEYAGQQALEFTRLLNFVDGQGVNQNPVIIAGDFNTRPGDPAIEAVVKARFHDVLDGTPDSICDAPGDLGCTRATTAALANPTRRQNVRIDYMFWRDGSDLSIRVVDAKPFMDQPYRTESGQLLWASDHIGVIATFAITPNASAKR